MAFESSLLICSALSIAVVADDLLGKVLPVAGF
jgi:hypothetical protein